MNKTTTAKKRKPFQKKAASKKNAKKTTFEQIKENESEQGKEIGAKEFESFVSNQFFYTSDRFFNDMDNREIAGHIAAAYPELSTNNSDSVIKKNLLEMLGNTQFIDDTLEKYKITIYDFFNALNSNYSHFFKGVFLKKVKAILSKRGLNV